MTLSRMLATAATGLALVLAPVAPALAQGEAPDIEASQVTEERLTLFVAAAMNVLEVADQYRGQIEAETDAQARQDLAEEANLAMLAAVEGTDGITVDEYLAISRAAQADADLNARVMEKFEEVGANG